MPIVSLNLLLDKSVAHSQSKYAAAVWEIGFINIISFLEQVHSQSVLSILSNYHRT